MQATVIAQAVEWKGKNCKIKSSDKKSFYINPYEGSPQDLAVTQGSAYLFEYIEKPDTYQGKPYQKKIVTKVSSLGGQPAVQQELIPSAPAAAPATQAHPAPQPRASDPEYVRGQKVGNALTNSVNMTLAWVTAQANAGHFATRNASDILDEIENMQNHQFERFKTINGVV